MKLSEVASAFVRGDSDRLATLLDEREQFVRLKNEPEWVALREVAQKAYNAVTEEGFNTPTRLEYAKGMRDGLWLLFQLVDDQVTEYQEVRQAAALLDDESLANDVVWGESPLE